MKNKKEKPVGKAAQEWFKQADYDIKTAKVMFDNKRYIYTVFMCHLAVEKALKGLCAYRLNAIPPKTHNLMFLIEKAMIEVPPELYDFFFFLNGVSVPTRYPDELQKLKKEYNKHRFSYRLNTPNFYDVAHNLNTSLRLSNQDILTF